MDRQETTPGDVRAAGATPGDRAPDRTTPTYWRSVERLLDSPAVSDALASGAHSDPEHPPGADQPPEGVTRRTMLGLMGASFGLAGLTACRRPVEHIVPYVDGPEGRLPGVPERYATTLALGTEVCGVVVESHEGRPTKVEGNRLHPASRGGSSSWLQGSILDLFDPDRSRSVLRKTSTEEGAEGSATAHEPSTWEEFASFWAEVSSEEAAPRGRGLAVLSESFASPTMARLARRFAERFPEARLALWEPTGDETVFTGIEQATGTARRPVLHLDRAQTVLALDADILLTEHGALAAARGFAAGRRAGLDGDGGTMNRLYVVESTMSVTGANADHRVALPSHRIGALAAALARRLGVPDLPDDPGSSADLPTPVRDRVERIADDLRQSGPDALVTAGRRQPPEVHALVHRINEHLGSVGRTVTLHDLADVGWGRTAELAELAATLRAGTVDTLVILGGNPVYDAPGAVDFAGALALATHTIHLSDRLDETSRLAEWHLPRAHALEAWGDARSADGTASVAQPLIAPLFDGRSPLEVLALLVGEEDWQGAGQVRRTWESLPETTWRRVLHDGVAAPGQGPEPGTPITLRRPEVIATLAPGTDPANRAASETGAPSEPTAEQAGDLELAFLISPSVRDGRFANNAWLQEQPDPLTRITWDNAALVSPATARRLGVETGDLVRLGAGDPSTDAEALSVEAPIWIAPGQADDSVAIELGFGRTAAGRVGDGVGIDANPLRPASGALYRTGVTAEPTGRRAELAQTQEHWAMEGRGLVREASVAEYREHPDFAHHEHDPPIAVAGPAPAPAGDGGDAGSLWQEPSYETGPQWGMAIDLASCIGCGACATACQAENNVPVVGREQVSRGREMHWLRIDRYFAGDLEDPRVVFQAVPCMHCENAPCEQVCPVAATVHDDEGLNAMVYNRCIGTRYCSNNCPYKVRRFNFFNYTNDTPELVKLAMNPDVTVRSRGVMEKCTYCVQRLNRGKLAAKKEGRGLADGDVETACQQACPAEAIAFGDLTDPESRVSRAKRSSRSYALLAELNNQPRTTYLAKVRNPNPAWPGSGAALDADGSHSGEEA